jgi:hypothetical protein
MTVDRGMWRRCRRLVDGLTIPAPFDPGRLVAELARSRGRPVELVPLPGGAPHCGVLVTTDRADYIFYAAGTTRLHREHIVLHEVGHLLCGHGAGETEAVPDVLVPHLSAELVRRVLGRSGYPVAQEQEAELVASMIAQRARRGATPAVAPEVAGGVARLGSIFDARPRDE